MEPTSPTLTGRRRPRARRGAVAVLAVLVLGTGCTGALSGDDGPAAPTTTEAPRALTAWPEEEAVATTTSPAVPDVEVGVRALLREADGTTTLLLDLENRGQDDLDVRALFGFDGLVEASIVDPASRARHAPLATSSGLYCLCSSSSASVPAGATTPAHVTFADVDAGVEEVRVSLPGWRPVDGVPVRSIGSFAARTTATTSFEADPDREVEVLGAWRAEGGVLLRIEDRNGTAESLSSFRLADLSTVAVIDQGTLRMGRTRTVSGSAVAEDTPSGGVAAGSSVTRDVLVAAPAGDPDAVLVRIPETRRTLPVTVQDDPPSTRLDGTGLDEATTAALEGPSVTERSPLVPLGDPAEVAVAETGPAVELPAGRDPLTSEAQPGWQVVPRAVVRTGAERAVLYLDLSRGDSSRSWPSGLGHGLEELALIDPAERQRLGVLDGSDGPDGSTGGVSVPTRGTRTAHVAFPAVAPGSRSVTVDVPGFGSAAGVPVIDGPDPAGPGDEVLASVVDDTTGRLRIDVLAVGRLPGDAGVLVRLRRVNDSAPDAYEPPGDGLCGASLSDPGSDRRFQPLAPCVTTDWSRPLGTGEALVQEVRFPGLPGDVDSVVLELDGWFGSAPVPVADEAEPWYLDLPRRAEAPDGDVLVASVGVADDLQTEVRDGDEVDLNLDTDVLFAFGSAQLSPEATARLGDVGERLAAEVRGGTVRIVGHTDSVGDDAANQVLSEQRAQAVADVLGPLLGSSVELDVEGRGASDPVADNEIDGVDNPDGRARNRRVTVTYTAG